MDGPASLKVEPDPLPLNAGRARPLPVVVERRRPLEFWAWHPRAALRRHLGHPNPAERQVVQPTALLVPLVGFDGHHYRLGYDGHARRIPLGAEPWDSD